MSEWVEVCAYDSIYPDTGVCALVDGQQVAVYRLSDGTLHALSNHDPFSGANVMSRGIVGDRGGEPKVASPIYKQSFDLRTGVCLDDTTVTVPTYPVRVVARDGRIDVEIQADPASSATGAESSTS